MFGEIELAELVVILSEFSAAAKTNQNMVETDGKKKDVSELAHSFFSLWKGLLFSYHMMRTTSGMRNTRYNRLLYTCTLDSTP